MAQIPPYTDKLGLEDHLASLGISITWIKKPTGAEYIVDDGREQETIDAIAAYDELPAHKAQKIDEIKAEGLRRINLIYPAIATVDDLTLIADLVKYMRANGAGAPTGNLAAAQAVYTAAKAAIAAVNAKTLVADVQTYDAVTSPFWP